MALDLEQVFAVLKSDLSVETVEVTPDLYSKLDRDYDGFRGHSLLALHEFDRPWASWECHPAGDEVVVLLTGRVRLRIRKEAGEEAIELASPGEYAVVPRGCWHTADARTRSRMLFVTPGEGTENRAESDLPG